MKKLLRLLISTMLITMIVFNLGACGKKTPAKDTYEDNNQVTKESSEDEKTQENKDVNKQEENKEEEKDTQKVEKENVYPIVLTDVFGNEVTIEKEPRTVVSISPEITETIYELGLGDKLIGRTDFCDFPSEVLEKESIGSLYEVNTEKVIDLNPDVILVSSLVKEEVVKQLMDNGLTVVALNWNENFDGVYTYMTTIGTILNKKEETESYIEAMKEKVNQLLASVEGLEKPTAYFVTGCGEWGDYAATGDTFLGQMLEMAGAENTAADGISWSYSLEQLVDKDPEILICSKSYDLKKQIETLDGYKDLTAVKEGNLFEVDENLFFRQGPRLVDGLATLIEVFHPGVLDLKIK